MRRTVKKYQSGGTSVAKVAKKAVASGLNAAKVAANKAKVEANKKKVQTNARNAAVNAAVEKGKANSSAKGVYKGKEYDAKGNLIQKYDVSSKTGPRSVYMASKGTLDRNTYDPRTNTRTGTTLDTTGYSAGKKNFTSLERVYQGDNPKASKITYTKIPSKDIPKKLKEMQKMKKGGVAKKTSVKKTITKSKRR